MTIEQAINLAIEGGYDAPKASSVMISPARRFGLVTAQKMMEAYIFLDPAYWQSLGKAMGWERKYLKLGDEVRIAPDMKKGKIVSMEKQMAKIRLDTGELEVVNQGVLRLFGKQWKNEWHRFIDHLASGGDINSFFETL